MAAELASMVVTEQLDGLRMMSIDPVHLVVTPKATAMIVVMPRGYGTMEMVARTTSGISDPNLRQRSYDGLRDALLKEVLPEVEKNYRATKNRAERAIAGL